MEDIIIVCVANVADRLAGDGVEIKLCFSSDLTSDDDQKQSDAQLAAVIAKGKGKMPSYDGKLKDTDITGLVAYIRGLAKK